MAPNRGDGEAGTGTAQVDLRIVKLVGGGRGLAHNDGATWLVSGGLPGETVRARATRRRAGIVEAEAAAVDGHRHPARAADPCRHAGVCGGCNWPHVDPLAGARLKVEAAAEAMRSHPPLAEAVRSAPILASPPASRLRARLHWDPDRRRLGFYAARSHRVAEISDCRILSPQLMAALPALERAVGDSGVGRVDLEWLEGTTPGDAVVALRPSRRARAGSPAGWVPTRERLGSVVTGCHRLTARGEIEAGWGSRGVRMALPVPLEVPVGAFFQGNRHLIAPLFARVAELAGRAGEPVFDLHAGVGFLAAAARSACERPMTLVEPQVEAARAAGRNLPEATVEIGVTAERFLAAARKLPRRSLVMTDPPRRGMSSCQIDAIAGWRPERILMLGCDAATWARDAGLLCGHGYRLDHIELFDLFPHTHHIEIAAVLGRV